MINDKGRPEYGKQYRLTGTKEDKCISNGNTWSESEVVPNETIAAMVRVCNKRFFRMVCNGDSTEDARRIILNHLLHYKRSRTWRSNPDMQKEISKLYEDWRTAPPGMSGRKEMQVIE